MLARSDSIHVLVGRFLRAHGVSRAARLLVAVSGGSDSVALLHVLLALGQRVGVAHVHHGLRGGEADREQAFVAELCRALGVPFHAARVDARRRDGRSPEARARALRYGALESLRVANGYAALLTAHQADDQAETVLLRALRGTGPGGLAAIRPSLDHGRVLRPLLGVRRTALSDYLARRGLAFATDSSNADLAIPRNRLRAEVVPVLEAISPAAVANLAHLAELARGADDAVRTAVALELGVAAEPGEGGLWVDTARLLALAPALRRRALAELASSAGIFTRMSRADFARIDEFLGRARAGQRLSLPRAHALFADRGRAWLGPAPGPRFPEPVRRNLAEGQVLEFTERRIRLSWRVPALDPASGLPSAARSSPLTCPVEPGDQLVVRSLCDADRVIARGRERRAKDVLAGARWSKLEQARALAVEREGRIVWIPGLLPMGLPAPNRTSGAEIRAVRLSSPR